MITKTKNIHRVKAFKITLNPQVIKPHCGKINEILRTQQDHNNAKIPQVNHVKTFVFPVQKYLLNDYSFDLWTDTRDMLHSVLKRTQIIYSFHIKIP